MENKNTAGIVRVSGSITDSFRKLKFVTIASLACVLLTAVGCVVYSLSTIREMNGKVYVIDRGQSFMATQNDGSVTRRDEIEFVSKRIHGLLFNVSGNRTVIQRNLEEALSLSHDRSIYEFYNNLQERGFYNKLREGNFVQEVIVDSVKVDMRKYPYRAATFCTVYKSRASVQTTNAMVTTMGFMEVPRDPQNLNGLKVMDFRIVSDEEIGRVKKQ